MLNFGICFRVETDETGPFKAIDVDAERAQGP